jgi:hypothetical protein
MPGAIAKSSDIRTRLIFLLKIELSGNYAKREKNRLGSGLNIEIRRRAARQFLGSGLNIEINKRFMSLSQAIFRIG